MLARMRVENSNVRNESDRCHVVRLQHRPPILRIGVSQSKHDGTRKMVNYTRTG